MDRSDVTKLLKEAKRNKGIKYSEIAQHLGVPKVWLVAAIHGQHPFSNAQHAKALLEFLEIHENADKIALILQEIPYRGDLGAQLPPTDPTVYRLFEFLQIYGPSIKELIHEEKGDGIMSAINAKVDVNFFKSEKGEDRVQVIFEGKFLPYQW